jgi:hypothetical protein
MLGKLSWQKVRKPHAISQPLDFTSKGGDLDVEICRTRPDVVTKNSHLFNHIRSLIASSRSVAPASTACESYCDSEAVTLDETAIIQS